jgi:hypothetical protein
MDWMQNNTIILSLFNKPIMIITLQHSAEICEKLFDENSQPAADMTR